jgi:hypothetical protein
LCGNRLGVPTVLVFVGRDLAFGAEQAPAAMRPGRIIRTLRKLP